jgi:hypothetical protein
VFLQALPMDELDKAWIEIILKKAEHRLGRDLAENERKALCKIRSLLAYEMIENTLDDASLSTEQIHGYVQSIAKEGS